MTNEEIQVSMRRRLGLGVGADNGVCETYDYGGGVSEGYYTDGDKCDSKMEKLYECMYDYNYDDYYGSPTLSSSSDYSYDDYTYYK